MSLLVRTVGLLCIAIAWAQECGEYCAFEVTVKSYSGNLLEGVTAELVGHDGANHGQGITDSHGVARICDAPAGMLDLVVGGNRCGSVAVRYLQRWYKRTRRIVIAYESCAGEHWAVPSGCRVWIRLRDGAGNAVPGVVLRELSGPARKALSSDRFGRILVSVPRRTALKGRLVKDGYHPKDFAVECRPGDQFEQGLDLVMQRNP